MSEVKFVHPYEGDCHRARIETSNGMPIAEVGVTVDEEIYYNSMNALELYLKAKFAENMMEAMGTLLEIGLTNSVREMIGDMCIMSRDDEIALQEAFEFRVMREMLMDID